MKIRILIISSLVLAACSPTYHDSLDQELAGKTPEERREILSRECALVTAKGQKPADPRYVTHADSMRRICEEMTGHNLPLNPGL